MIIGGILAWTMLKSVPIKANIRSSSTSSSNQDTWWMTLLYIMTFGTFSGSVGAVRPAHDQPLRRGQREIVKGTGATAQVLVEGYAVPDPVKYVFLGPLVGAGARVLFSPLTDRMGGAIWTSSPGSGWSARSSTRSRR
jgi:NNP family nitrate/nitrite transporter-like MFS transporter